MDESTQASWDTFLDIWTRNNFFMLTAYTEFFDNTDSLIAANGFGSPDNCLAVGGPLVIISESE